MPHRATYFFPRQFSGDAVTNSSSKSEDHEKLSEEIVGFEINGNKTSVVSEGDRVFGKKNDRIHRKKIKKPLAALVSWLEAEKKAGGSGWGHVKFSHLADHDKNTYHDVDGGDHDDLSPVTVKDVINNSNSQVTNIDDLHHQIPLEGINVIDRQLSNGSRYYSGVVGKHTGFVDRQVSSRRISRHDQSSYAGCLFSGTITTPNSVFCQDSTREEKTRLREEELVAGNVDGGDDSRWSLVRTWCKTYYLQLTLAKRLTHQATIGEEPTLFPSHGYEGGHGVVSYDAESVSYRLWVNGTLSYNDKVSDGFYNILGMDPYMWMICNDSEEGKRVPSLLELKAVEASTASMEVILVDRYKDSQLRDLEDKAQELYLSAENTLMLAEKLGKLVAASMGGSFPVEQGCPYVQWELASKRMRELQNNILVPIGSMSMGLCRHRAILFKKLADYVGLPCRIARGCRYCVENHRSSCLIRLEDDKFTREYVIDLVGKPGNFYHPDSSINGDILSSVPSPFQTSHLKVAQQVYGELPSISQVKSTHVPRENPSYSVVKGEARVPDQDSNQHGQSKEKRCVQVNRNNRGPEAVEVVDVSTVELSGDDGLIIPKSSSNENTISRNSYFRNASKKDAEVECDGIHRGDFLETSPRYLALEPSLAMDWLEIAWDELHIKERIGAGSFGTVHRAEWHGSDVAVKVLISQDLHDDQLKEFLREVSIMKRVRHPNVVLFMGAVTVYPHFSIVTEYLPRGSLFRLLHHPASGEIMNMKRRMRMALDVAKGINYLHCLSPPVVHWDLKSPNLLVDKNWTVKVCDFGLSRFKADTFISSKSIVGTTAWMAPEFLRGELADEKSDVYSFGVILWELVTMQQPWSGLNAAQMVGAVAFQNRKLTIPHDTLPILTSLMESCWADDPVQRPSFKSIMTTLKKLLKSPHLLADNSLKDPSP